MVRDKGEMTSPMSDETRSAAKTMNHLKKTTLIQFGMECVRGPLKFQLMMTTVTRIETVFMMKVNRRYLSIDNHSQFCTYKSIGIFGNKEKRKEKCFLSLTWQ